MAHGLIGLTMPVQVGSELPPNGDDGNGEKPPGQFGDLLQWLKDHPWAILAGAVGIILIARK